MVGPAHLGTRRRVTASSGWISRNTENMRWHFAIFMGIAKKTEAGWIPFQRERQPIAFCDHTGPKGSRRCWLTPYQKPSPEALPNPDTRHTETWSMSKAGIVQYIHRSRTTRQAGQRGTEDAAATLNLETGRYEMIIRDYEKGVHEWAVKGGVELWRNITFTAQAKLVTVDCPAALQTVVNVPRRVKPVAMEGLRPCVIKIKPKGSGSDPGFEFLQNPGSATLAGGLRGGA